MQVLRQVHANGYPPWWGEFLIQAGDKDTLKGLLGFKLFPG